MKAIPYGRQHITADDIQPRILNLLHQSIGIPGYARSNLYVQKGQPKTMAEPDSGVLRGDVIVGFF